MKKSKKNYKGAKGARFGPKKAQKYGEFLERLTLLQGGKITAKDVVKAARSEDSPIHDYFDWDDTTAATKWRIVQANHLISHLEIVIRYKEEDKTTRAFFSLEYANDTGKKRSYFPVETVAGDSLLKEQLIQDALDELKGWQRRYQEYKELELVFVAIEEVQAKLVYDDTKKKRGRPKKTVLLQDKL